MKTFQETIQILRGGDYYLVVTNFSYPESMIRILKGTCIKHDIIFKHIRLNTDETDLGQQRQLLATTMKEIDANALYIVADDRRGIRKNSSSEKEGTIRKLLFSGHRRGSWGSPQAWRSNTDHGCPQQIFIFDLMSNVSFAPGLLFEDNASEGNFPYINQNLKRYTYPGPSILREKDVMFPSVWKRPGVLTVIAGNIRTVLGRNELCTDGIRVWWFRNKHRQMFDATFRLHLLVLVACRCANRPEVANFQLKVPADGKSLARDFHWIWTILKKKTPLQKEGPYFKQADVWRGIQEIVKLLDPRVPKGIKRTLVYLEQPGSSSSGSAPKRLRG